MVQRYRFNYVQEMFETETGEQHNETERGEWVKYEDYAALKADRDYWYEKCLDAGLLDEKPEEE